MSTDLHECAHPGLAHATNAKGTSLDWMLQHMPDVAAVAVECGRHDARSSIDVSTRVGNVYHNFRRVWQTLWSETCMHFSNRFSHCLNVHRVANPNFRRRVWQSRGFVERYPCVWTSFSLYFFLFLVR